jgi:hypothetical protein
MLWLLDRWGIGAAGGGGAVLFTLRCVENEIDGQERRPGASAHGRARGGFLPSNSWLLYFLSIDYINRSADRPYLEILISLKLSTNY